MSEAKGVNVPVYQEFSAKSLEEEAYQNSRICKYLPKRNEARVLPKKYLSTVSFTCSQQSR